MPVGSEQEAGDDRRMSADQEAAWKSAGWMRQREDGLFSVRLRVVGGHFDSERLEALAELARRFGRGIVHLTTRQGIEVPHVRGADRTAFEAALAARGLGVGACGSRVRTVTACQGGLCPNGLYDPQELARRLDERLFGWPGLPHKLKIALAGCANACTKPAENDLGLTGAIENLWRPERCNGCGMCVEVCPSGSLRQTAADAPPGFAADRCLRCGRCTVACPTGAWEAGRSGFLLWVGGMMGASPRLARRLGGLVEGEDRVVGIAVRLAGWYAAHGRSGERLARTVDRVGIDALERSVMEETG